MLRSAFVLYHVDMIRMTMKVASHVISQHRLTFVTKTLTPTAAAVDCGDKLRLRPADCCHWGRGSLCSLCLLPGDPSLYLVLTDSRQIVR